MFRRPPAIATDFQTGGDRYHAGVLEDAVSLPFPSRVPARAWLEVGRIRHVQWSGYRLPIATLPAKLEGLRLLHLTDLHVTPVWMPAWDRLLARVAADPPDLICVSGDFVDSKHDPAPAVPTLRRLLDRLPSRLGLYGTLGNHDGDVLPVFAGDWPVRLLCNETVCLRDGGTTLEIVGLHGVEPTDASPRVLASLPARGPEALRVVMAHYPSQATWLAPGMADVVLTGHTHGGQVCLPGGWPPVTHEALPRRFARGVHWLGDRWLIVGRGLGFSTHRVRAFCPAEAIELTLVRGAAPTKRSEPHSGR